MVLSTVNVLGGKVSDTFFSRDFLSFWLFKLNIEE